MEIPKVIYPCNHEIISMDAVAVVKKITKASGDFDEIIANGAVSSISHVYQFTPSAVKFFFEGEDFTLSQARLYQQIEWISLTRPDVGDEFIVEYVQNIRSSRKYSEYECPRCSGNGWYVSFLLDKNAVTVTNFSKLIQDFIKVMFTEKQNDDGYGSNLHKIIGTNFASEDAMIAAITQEVNSCVVQLQNIQSSEMSAGATVTDEERIAGAAISDAYYDEESGGLVASVTIKNASTQTAVLTFNI